MKFWASAYWGFKIINNEDIWGSIGVGLSAIMSTLGFLWNVGALQIIFSFLTGGFATYVFQHRLQVASEKRKNIRQKAITMRNKIYGPLYSWMIQLQSKVNIVEEITDFFGEQRIRHISGHFLYSIVDETIRKQISGIISRAEKYEKIRESTETKLKEIIRRKIIQIHQVDTEGTPSISTLIGKTHVGWMSLNIMILHEITPESFVENEKKRWGNDLNLKIQIGAQKENREDFINLFQKVLEEVEKGQICTDERTQRKLLLTDISQLLQEIRPFVEV